MNYTFLRLVIILYVHLFGADAIYNKDVVCVFDKGQVPVCEAVASPGRRNNDINKNVIPSHDPYIPRKDTVLYNCSTLECNPLQLYSFTQVTSPKLNLKSCFLRTSAKYDCEPIRYNYLKNIDKLLFLSDNLKNKTFYLVDCLVYPDSGRVCHKKDDKDSLSKLVDTGSIARPKEPNVLSQEEFLCEESEDKVVNCDIDPFVPFDEGLKLKESVKIKGDVLLKTGSYVLVLKKNCIDSWCGYSGKVPQTRRTWFKKYEPPGGTVFRCYYAKRQQICKPMYHKDKLVYNERNWLSS